MLQELEIERLFAESALPEAGRQLVRDARANSPVRKANSRLGNSIIDFLSKKMGGRHLELESRTVEAAAAAVYEDDSTCLEFWPQPLKIDILIKDNDGKIKTRKQHFPDFLVIRGDGIYVHEWREESRLMALAAEGAQFYRGGDNHWHFKAAEEFFANTGLHYEVHSANELQYTYIRNIRFLEDYQTPECPPLPEEDEVRLLKLLSERGSVPYLELLHEHSFTAGSIFKAIVKRLAFVDLYNQLLETPTDLIIHRDMAIARFHSILSEDRTPPLPIPGMARLSAGARLIYNGEVFEVVLVGGGNVVLKNNHGYHRELTLDDTITLYNKSYIEIYGTDADEKPLEKSLAEYSMEQIDAANMRLVAITDNDTGKVNIRTLQRWGAKINGAVSKIDKLIALVDRNQDKGNRTTRLPDIVESLAVEIISKLFNTPEYRTALDVYGPYQLLCEEHGVVPMSYPTFSKRVKALTSVKEREGRRKAYQDAPIPLILDYRFPVNGSRPHEVCYIDHTIMNIATVGPDGSMLGKPTFTLATDGHTTQTRAFYLSYDPPSTGVVLMALRDYVRRQHRLPKILVVDGGKEFKSRELKYFCEFYDIDLRHRSQGMPRSGSPVERAIGASETEVISKLKGNTLIMKENTRLVTKSVNPFSNAVWTLIALHGALDEYLFNIRDNRIHPSLGLTPRDYELMRMEETGQREHLLVKFDKNIMLMTSPHPICWTRIIDRKRGVWADNMYYWNDELYSAKPGEKVEVRIEPWNANIVYVYFRTHWIAAIARDLKAFDGHTRRETQIALRTERRRAKTNANKDKTSIISAKNMLGLWNPEKFDERIGKQQSEMTYLYSRIEMTLAMPESIPTDLESSVTPADTPISDTNNTVEPVKKESAGDDAITDDFDIFGGVDGYL